MGRKKSDSDEKGADVGMVMTVSLFLILLTFFILLNSIAVLDENRVRMSIGSLIGAFGSLSGGISPMHTGKSVMPPSAPVLDKELDISQMLASMSSERVSGELVVHSMKGREIITMGEGLLFHSNSNLLKTSAADVLNKMAHFLKKGIYPIEIVGHSDDVPASEKGYASNWELSSLMALQVHKFFAANSGIDLHRITSYGVAAERPEVDNETPSSRLRNRRVDIILNYEMTTYEKRIHVKKPPGEITYKKFNFKVLF